MNLPPGVPEPTEEQYGNLPEYFEAERKRQFVQQLAIAEMERITRRADAMNVVPIPASWRWSVDTDGRMHLACDTAPVAAVKIHGMANIERLWRVATGQDPDSDQQKVDR